MDKDEAIDGVNSGAYYAALIIPKSFSADMMTVFSPTIKHAKIEYYLNEKINQLHRISPIKRQHGSHHH